MVYTHFLVCLDYRDLTSHLHCKIARTNKIMKKIISCRPYIYGFRNNRSNAVCVLDNYFDERDAVDYDDNDDFDEYDYDED